MRPKHVHGESHATGPRALPRRGAWAGLFALLLALAVLAAAASTAPSARAEGNADCLECHDDVVDAKKYAASVHAELECVFCHQDVELNEDFEHEKDLAPVDCAECHEDAVDDHDRGRHGEARKAGNEEAPTCVDCHTAHETLSRDDPKSPTSLFGVQELCAPCHEDQARDHARSDHGRALKAEDKMAPSCVDCHSHHHIRSHLDPTSPTSILNIPGLCGGCHKEGSPVSRTHDIGQEKIFRNYSQSLHGAGLFEQGLTVTAVCTSCHTSHNILPHTDPASSVHPDNVVKTCLKCHGRIESVHDKVIEGRLWEEAPGMVPVCVDCHFPHEQRLRPGVVSDRNLYVARVRNERCLGCHASDEFRGRTMEKDGRRVSLYVEEDQWYAAAHASAKPPVACAGCHTEVTTQPEERNCETITSPVDCAVCHAEQVEQHMRSVHGQHVDAGDADAPTCLDCHEKHNTLSHHLPISPTFPRNVPELCARCHREGGQAAVRIDTEAPIVESYLMSIHGKGLKDSGLLVTATCIDCHTAHEPRRADDPLSAIHHDNVADTCGRCHHGIEEEFRKSIHWPGNGKTDRTLPSCKDCHTSHEIRRHDRDDFRLLMRNQCGGCHEEETYTFEKTVHGQYTGGGSLRHAKCHDCHGSHQILPPSHRDSTLSLTNIVGTCSQCHQAAHQRFAGYLTHATHTDRHRFPWLWWTFWGMTALLVGTLAVSLFHAGAWLTRLVRTREEWKAHKALARTAPGQKLYRRFDRYQRTQHIVMLISFFTLAITGMLVKFSYTGWAQTMSQVISFDDIGLLHRFGAVVLFIVFFVHLWYVRRKRKASGRTWKQMITGPDSIIFQPRDVKEAWQSIKWFFGRGPRPRYGRYTYWEKFDYFAVFWGVAVIGITGLMRWFPELFTYVVPGWFINVAAIIHSDEALLAVGFIFTIHFFNTHFRPDKFPMDPVIFTGRMTVKELEYDRPEEYEELVRSGDLEKHLVDPFPAGVVKAFKVFGFVMLGIGLSLIVLIVVGMILGPR